MCDIWRVKEDGALTADDYRRLPAPLDNVGITGGEPFMRKDLVDIVRAVSEACGRPRIIVNTNGYLTERILTALQALRPIKPQVGVGISLDGTGAAHDRMRGTANAFQKVIRTLRALKDEGFRDLRVSYTATNDNVGELVAVYELARKLGVELAIGAAQNSAHYFHTTANAPVDARMLRQAIAIVNRRELSSRSLKSWLRTYYNSGVAHFNEHRKRLLPCSAGHDFFFVSPRGDLYPCLILDRVIGNIAERSFEELWNTARAAEARAEVSACERCWMMCTARTQMKRHIFKVAAWVAREKLALNPAAPSAPGGVCDSATQMPALRAQLGPRARITLKPRSQA
jgi:radical SAM protein with 4Fe4S-binding SPASM domain